MAGYATRGTDVAVAGVAICLSKDGKAEKLIRDCKGAFEIALLFNIGEQIPQHKQISFTQNSEHTHALSKNCALACP